MPSPRPQTIDPVALQAVSEAAGRSSDIVGDADLTVTGVTLSTFSVRPGDLYAALPGANAHGASYAAAAVREGARALLTDVRGLELAREAGVDVPAVVVADPRSVLGRVAAAVYGTGTPGGPGVRSFGITGTNGKTTTAYLLAAALEALGRSTGLIGTVETRIGQERVPSARTTPESPDLHALLAVMRERGVDDCVMEVSSHALVLHRVDEVVYDVALFTNLSQDHLDFHDGMEDYFAAKASLFTPERSRAGVVCVDDAWGRRLAAQAGVPVSTVSSDPAVPADLVITSVAGPAFVLEGDGVSLALRSPLPGGFNRTNTAVAAAALLVAGHDPAEVARAVGAEPRVPGRMEVVAAPEGADAALLPRVVVDFAHTPDAVAAALAALREGTTGRLVAVLGAGGSRDPGKRPGMGRAAADHADLVVVTDDNPRSEDPAAIREAVASGARQGGAELDVVADRRAAVEHAVRAAGPGGVVALLGKGHESGQEVDGVVTPFDDRVVALEALTALATEVAR
ncbi:UDP-N-acetylmuramoyl-L-alanyl-D-glutamate--2,6-diaminopimelate ligase [Janibacter sp. Y6]|uniref:UDP-N-acetylmuramoyl-L-alanyl-D-glutamate--2, 6-diaminopimelate ligase n=1 Tax=Janibacter sp. Y6 TaxID=2913552 RepID=UPI0034A17FD6